MTRLILIRHGQSVANALEVGAGQKDYALTDLGKKQAELAALYLTKNEKIDLIYSSDLQRAYDTVLPIAEKLGLPITSHPALREIDTGDFAGMKIMERNKLYPEKVKILKNDFGHMQYPNGESVKESYERVVSYICEIARENDGKCLLIATHAGAIRLFQAFSDGLSWEDAGKAKGTENASINVFECDGDKANAIYTNFTDHVLGFESALPDGYKI